MLNVTLVVGSRLNNLAVEAGAVFLTPVEDAVHHMPVVAHVKASVEVIGHGGDFLKAEKLSVLGVGPVQPSSIRTVARPLKFGREVVVTAVLRKPGCRKGVEFATEGSGLCGGVAAITRCRLWMFVLMVHMSISSVIMGSRAILAIEMPLDNAHDR